MTASSSFRLASSCFSLAFLVGLAACGATALRPGAERVMVTHQPPSDECRYVGTVIGEQGGWLSGPFTSNANLAQGAVNDMKNKAHDLGANYVELETTTAGNIVSGDAHGVRGQQTDVTHMSNAFMCPKDGSPSPEAAR